MNLDLHLFGATGKVGLEIISLARRNKKINKIFEYNSKQKPNLKEKADGLVIDFSSPEGMLRALDFAVKQRIPFVSGTTGISKNDFTALKSASKKTPVFWSPNMSIGVATLRKALKSLSHLDGYDFQIEELHHNRKKDSPSGTAKLLQSDLEKIIGQSLPAPVAIRGGGIFGVHKVYSMSEDDVIVFEHQALNRKVFARGALDAGIWLTQQKPGFYSMEDWIK